MMNPKQLSITVAIGLVALMSPFMIGATRLAEDTPSIEMTGTQVPQQWVQASFREDLTDGITVEVFVDLSEVVQSSNGSPMRILAMTTLWQAGPLVLERDHTMRSVSLDSAAPLEVHSGLLDLGFARAMATEFLGESDPSTLSEMVAAGEVLEPHTIVVQPSPSTVWGAVVLASELSVHVIASAEQK